MTDDVRIPSCYQGFKIASLPQAHGVSYAVTLSYRVQHKSNQQFRHQNFGKRNLQISGNTFEDEVPPSGCVVVAFNNLSSLLKT